MDDQEKIQRVKSTLHLRYSSDLLDRVDNDRWLEVWDVMEPMAREHKRHVEGEEPRIRRVSFGVFSGPVAIVPPEDQWLSVESSNVDSIAIGATIDLFVRFNASDKVYMYSVGWVDHYFWGMYSADSPGGYFHKHIKQHEVKPEIVIHL